MVRHVYQGSGLFGIIAPCAYLDEDFSERLKHSGYGFLRHELMDGDWTYFGSLVNCSNAIVITLTYTGVHQKPTNMHLTGIATEKMATMEFLDSCIDHIMDDTNLIELPIAAQASFVQKLEKRWKSISDTQIRGITGNSEHRMDFSRWQANRRS